MHNEHPNKISRFFTIFMLLLLALILTLFGYFVSPVPPEQVCTLMGCRDSLAINLTKEPPTAYSLIVTAASGESRRVSCNPGVISNHSSVACHLGNVTFFDFTPSSLTVEITWQGGSFSASGNPSYHFFHPNGPSCPPKCQTGSFQIVLP